MGFTYNLSISAEMVKMIKLCMNKTRCKVRYNQHISDEFEVKTGLRQGDALVFPTLSVNSIKYLENVMVYRKC